MKSRSGRFPWDFPACNCNGDRCYAAIMTTRTGELLAPLYPGVGALECLIVPDADTPERESG
jgi:hypothetical protein